MPTIQITCELSSYVDHESELTVNMNKSVTISGLSSSPASEISLILSHYWIEFESEDEVDHDAGPSSISPQNSPYLEPTSFIEVIHHPHSGKATSTVIHIDKLIPLLPDSSSQSSVPWNTPKEKPWAPFRTWPYFEFAEIVVTQSTNILTVNILLSGFHRRWAPKTYLTFHNANGLQKSLSTARHFSIQVSPLLV